MKKNPSGQLSPELVRAEVERFWSIFTSKVLERLEEFYDPEAVVFASAAIRSEAGRITVVRRSREYFSPQAKLRHRLGTINVQVIGDEAAVASYAFEFEARNVTGMLATVRDEKITHGRATQVFTVGHDGTLRIVHEHFSAAMTQPEQSSAIISMDHRLR
jgi:ketosteroid isomerase-like protein